MNTGKSLEEQQFEACYEAIVKEITEQSDAKLICMSPFIVPYPRMYENWIPGIKQTERIEKKIAEKYHADFLALQDMIILKAEKAGYEHPYGIAAPSDPIMQVHYVVREAAALIKAKIYGNI